MNNNFELNLNELDIVSGGLQDNKYSDQEYQRAAQQNGGSNTVGGSLTDAGNTVVFTGGTAGQGHGYKG